MKTNLISRGTAALAVVAFAVAAAGCGTTAASQNTANTAPVYDLSSQMAAITSESSSANLYLSSESGETQTVVTSIDTVVEGGLLDTSDIFSKRDLRQEADLTDAKYLTVADNTTLDITEEGVYVISGSAANATIKVNTTKDAKVQLVLNGVTIENDDFPAIYVVSADKVFITTAKDTANTLTVMGTFVADGETNTDAVIFSKDDLVLNGLGTLTIGSSDNGISCKDDLKITGGTYEIAATADAIEANDSVSIADGSISIWSLKDGIHCENDDDSTKGTIYICGGTMNIIASSDGIQGTPAVQIDSGTISISSSEGIEATYVQINGGTVSIEASDDGINASNKSVSYEPTIEINGGDITIVMGAGDTDALDANGYLYIHGGTINITANFAFDFDRGSEFTGGTVIVNGQQVTSIQNSMMGPGGMGGGMMGPGGATRGPRG